MSVSQETASAGSRAARELGDLLASIEVRADWPVVETTAQTLANALRNREGSVDEHTTLGKTLLPQTLTSLLKVALEGSRVPDDAHAAAVLELLRVGANLCMDHNENRGHLLDSGFPQLVVSLLEGYAEYLPEIPSYEPFSLSNAHLKIIKTAVGALLNLSLGYEPIQTRLISLETPVTLLRLSIALYPPGTWLSVKETGPGSIDAESWTLRKGITEWSWRAISGLKDNQVQQPLFGPESLPHLVVPLKAFLPPFPVPTNSLYSDITTRKALLATDVEVLEEACELIETLTMDIEDVRLALARGMAYNEQPPCLALMLDFIESAEYATGWQDSGIPQEEVVRWKHALDLCKTAIIRSVVEISGEEDNLDVLWDDAMPQNGFVSRLIKWLQPTQDTSPGQVHDDLVICGTLSLGNLVRRENNSIALVNAPISITPHLVKYLAPATDLKVKHGVIGLLKHLAQSSPNRKVLGEAHVIESLRSCEVFSENADIAEIVQMSAINLAKHLCTHNVGNAIICVLDGADSQSSVSCLSQILALSQRSDSVPVKSEGARVLVNIVKSLCSSTGDLNEPRRKAAIKAVTNAESATTLARLLGRSKKHVILLNESIVSMCLLALQSGGALLVLDAVVANLPKEIPPPSRQNSLNSESVPSSGGTPSAPVTAPKTALEVLVSILQNLEGRIPAELRANLCQLLGEIGRDSLKTESLEHHEKVEQVRQASRDMLQSLKGSPDSLALSAAAGKALDSW
ncbi:uncharacterized protein FOMMEDRAFT_104451 [Fomitiporia mediterranea MF3/22]|uniref:uncharacterized protein n=1 Tax=Fomitiporia mediterranea (strain MF3/22) TaxID=694068 RepID=UPI00044090A9|nr:uncharacterized protein FOMMEDRAFT_104451 [Fomitiporia mediterranea MF3/22]EJD06025.1 hypothetical protein FOMMEDRAFT_104451 [Fomitiporia mediterranea MF3/22]